MQTINMKGELAELFTDTVRLDVRNAGEAIRALDANFPGFRQYLAAEGRAFAVLVDEESIGEEDVPSPIGQGRTIELVPVVHGAGGDSGVFRIILGAVLIAASFFLPVTPLIAGSTFSLSTIASAVGWSLLIGGVSQLLFGVSPVDSTPQEAAEHTPSDYFNGAVNTTAEGQAISIGYGRMIVGSHVVSAGFIVRDA